MGVWCDDCQCTSCSESERTHDNVTIVIGTCRSCGKMIINRWKRERSISLRQPSNDRESNILVALKGVKNGSQIV